MSKAYIHNLETGKIELHFEKAEYKALPDSLKTELKHAYLWSSKAGAWVSRSVNNHYSALRVAEKLGFTECEKVGERLSYEEQLDRKAEKAENRAERFEEYAGNAERKAETLQAGIKAHRGDIAFFTQPNINSSGGRSFTNYRNRLFNRFEKGFEEYRKSKYFKERADTARQTADRTQLKDKRYLNNRIEESNARIRSLQRAINTYSNYPEKENYCNELLEKLEWEIDKLAFLQNCMEELGGVAYSQENVKVGYLVKIRGTWDLVLKANPKTVLTKVIEGGAKGFVLTHPYAEIKEMKIPENWQEESKTIENPFMVNDIVVAYGSRTDLIFKAFQIIKTSDKTVTIRQIEIKDNKPIPDSFKKDRTQERRSIKKDSQGNIVVNSEYNYLHKYVV